MSSDGVKQSPTVRFGDNESLGAPSRSQEPDKDQKQDEKKEDEEAPRSSGREEVGELEPMDAAADGDRPGESMAPGRVETASPPFAMAQEGRLRKARTVAAKGSSPKRDAKPKDTVGDDEAVLVEVVAEMQ